MGKSNLRGYLCLTLNQDIYIEDDYLSNIENDILYYINKHYALTFSELKLILSHQDNDLIYQLRKLMDKCIIGSQHYRNLQIYSFQGFNHFSLRKKLLIQKIEELLKNGALSFLELHQKLSDEKLCYDSQLVENLIDANIYINKFTEDGVKWVYYNPNKTLGKLIFCPECQALLKGGTCSTCRYRLPFMTKNSINSI